MRIEQLYIKDFKNLKEFSIDFDKEALTSVIVGRNATGKSNLMEALVTIFRKLGDVLNILSCFFFLFMLFGYHA